MVFRQGIALGMVVALAAGVGCSSESTCEKAFGKVKACMNSLDCTQVPAAQQMACEFNKSVFDQFPESMWIQACEQDTSGGVEKLAQCTLDPNTCECADAPPVRDGGPIPNQDGMPPADAFRDFTNPTDAPAFTPVSWAQIPAGSYLMGCSPNDTTCDDAEKPPHRVTITAFEMTTTEITQEQYQAVMSSNPSGNDTCATCPVEQVTWQRATEFCTAIGGRLPSEAEWEYAARGGTTTIAYCGDDLTCMDNIAWHGTTAGAGVSHPVAQKASNAYGLYDMHGNVWEWNNDCWHPDYVGHPGTNASWLAENDGRCDRRMLRGGSFSSMGDWELRASSRGREYADIENSNLIGFRCAR